MALRPLLAILLKGIILSVREAGGPYERAEFGLMNH
jgi:hypothetical protein